MIKSNLAVLLAERNLRITQVSNDTGISRTTLTALGNNYSQGIQLDTLNKLCLYLKVTPNILFNFIPFDFSFELEHDGGDLYNLIFSFDTGSKIFKGRLLALTYLNEFTLEDYESGMLEIFAELPNPSEDGVKDFYPNVEKENEVMLKFFPQIPPIFISDIQKQIYTDISKYITGHELNFTNLLEFGIKSTKELKFRKYSINFPSELFNCKIW